MALKNSKRGFHYQEEAEFREEKELFNRALSLRDSGRFEEAIKILRGFVERYPNLPTPSGMLGGVYYEAGRFEDAVGSALRAVELNPRSELASLILLHSLLHLGKVDDAKTELRRFLALADSEEYRGILSGLETLPQPGSVEFQEILSELKGS